VTARHTYARCPRCHRAIPAGHAGTFCPLDGARLVLTCQHCGERITSPHATQCVFCHRSVLGAEPHAPAPKHDHA